MTANRQNSAWIWVAVAAIAMATLARAEAGLPRTLAHTNPVLQFLSAHASDETLAALQGMQGTNRAQRSSPGHRSGVWAAMLPILFVGLVAPLSLTSPGEVLCLGRASAAPALPCRFQRPPPAIYS